MIQIQNGTTCESPQESKQLGLFLKGTCHNNSASTLEKLESMVRSLILAAFVVAVRGQGCSVCGDGLAVTNPDAIFAFPGQPEVPCGLLEQAGQTGAVPLDQCGFLAPLITVCECAPAFPDVPTAPAPPTPTPTGKGGKKKQEKGTKKGDDDDDDVEAPTYAPILPPTNDVAPIVAPVDAPTSPTFAPIAPPTNGKGGKKMAL
jgi:hypothetical protein